MAEALPVLGITVGDPAGVGPEIVARALAESRLPDVARVVVFAEPRLFRAACGDAGIDLPPVWHDAQPTEGVRLAPIDAGPVPPDFEIGTPSAFTGRVAAGCVEAAARAALDGRLDAIVTAPLAKSALVASGVNFPGHTELLADLSGRSSVAMMFVAPEIRVTLATIHVPLAEVSSRLTIEGLVEKIQLTGACLRERAGIEVPRIAVLGLNPHAGEGGLFGDEDDRIVAPAVEVARGRGWTVEGPIPADSFFLRWRHEYDAVVAMYHDQGLIPVKLLSGGMAVNVTLGLPFLRTSVDHGTAFDIAGRGIARLESLLAAADLAVAWSTGP